MWARGVNLSARGGVRLIDNIKNCLQVFRSRAVIVSLDKSLIKGEWVGARIREIEGRPVLELEVSISCKLWPEPERDMRSI